MHVAVDFNWILQLVFTAVVVAIGLLHLLKNTASRYFTVDANFEASDSNFSDHNKTMATTGCAACGNPTKKQCAACKVVKYCSEDCQVSHWKSEHKAKCKDFQLSGKINLGQPRSNLRGKRASTSISLVPSTGTPKNKQLKEILFPYDEFLELFNWGKLDFPPCGLLNCGNSCFANVVLQCLTYTRPLVAYLLEKGHQRECRRNDWCFLCEFQKHVERTSRSVHPFSPINILSRLPNIGGNLGYGEQEDAHEFMRFAIDAMQSASLDEFGGEKAVHPCSQETTLIQHIFGGHLQSQVICTKCNNVSNQFESMMDLTVEIQGDAASLEQCLDQFTAREWLDGDNMYKCDKCNDYVMAWKRLTIRQAPNILTIALKRFQSGRYGKLNKRVTFPETLDLCPYMSETGGDDVYKLYAVIVHVDMLNASYFGHYICYIKDFRGRWYRIDDCRVTIVDLDEVLSQGAYMLLYSRIRARLSCLSLGESQRIEANGALKLKELKPALLPHHDCSSAREIDPPVNLCLQPPDNSLETKAISSEEDVSSIPNYEKVGVDIAIVDSSKSSDSNDTEVHDSRDSSGIEETALLEFTDRLSDSTNLLGSHPTEKELPVVNQPFTSDPQDVSEGIESCRSKIMLRSSSPKDTPGTRNNTIEHFGIPSDVTASPSSGEVIGLMNSAVSEVELDATDHSNNLHLPIGIRDATFKLNGSSAPRGKVKPLLRPGFLARSPQSKYSKQELKVTAEFCEKVLKINPTVQSNGFPQPGLSQNETTMYGD